MKRSMKSALILLAEDDVAYGDALATLLRADGHEVRLVLDGEDAVRVLRTEGHRISLVLTDLLLPSRSGFQVAREALEAGVDAPILVMTGVYDNLRDMQALRALGVRGWIHKSAPFEHVLFRVNSLLWPAAANERRATRVAAALPVQYRIGERVHYATTYNVSTTGLYVRVPEPPEPGTEIELGLGLPTAREMLMMRVEVVHAATLDEVRGTAYPVGFGARFLDPSPLATSALRHFVESAAAGDGAAIAPACEDDSPGDRVTDPEPAHAGS